MTEIKDCIIYLEKNIPILLSFNQLFFNWRVNFKENGKFGMLMFNIGYSIDVFNQIISTSENDDKLIFSLAENADLFKLLEEQLLIAEEMLNIPFDEKFDFTSLAKKVD